MHFSCSIQKLNWGSTSHFSVASLEFPLNKFKKKKHKFWPDKTQIEQVAEN